jgi:hypothetical protein
MRVSAGSAREDLLFAKTAHAAHRERPGPTGCSSANREPDSCKHRSSHDSGDLSAAAVGVMEQSAAAVAHDCFPRLTVAEVTIELDDPPVVSGLPYPAVASQEISRFASVRWSGWRSEPLPSRCRHPPRWPRQGAGTTNAPTARRNRERFRVRTRRCRRAPAAPRPRNRCDAYGDSRSRRRSVKGLPESQHATAARDVSGLRLETASTRTIAFIVRGGPRSASALRRFVGSRPAPFPGTTSSADDRFRDSASSTFAIATPRLQSFVRTASP